MEHSTDTYHTTDVLHVIEYSSERDSLHRWNTGHSTALQIPWTTSGISISHSPTCFISPPRHGQCSHDLSDISFSLLKRGRLSMDPGAHPSLPIEPPHHHHVLERTDHPSIRMRSSWLRYAQLITSTLPRTPCDA